MKLSSLARDQHTTKKRRGLEIRKFILLKRVIMPKPKCVQCDTTDSYLWRSSDDGQICNECYTSNLAIKDSKTDTKPSSSVKPDADVKLEEKEDTENNRNDEKDEETTPAKATGKGTRKSTRSTRYKAKTPGTGTKAPSGRGRGRRSLFKRPPLKAPPATPTIVTSESLFYKGMYIQVGDIVSMTDIDGGTYYAQIRGLLTDEYCEKSAVVTWLLPTKASPPPDVQFDPSTYIIGPEEDLPRKLDYMEFVMHAPSDYYKSGTSPYPPSDSELNDYTGFIWTTLDPVDRPQAQAS